MRTVSFIITVLLVVQPLGAERLETTDLAPMMAGDYLIIGKLPDSAVTYSGQISFRDRGDKLEFTRSVLGRSVHGVATFTTIAGSDRIPVLVMRFSQGGRDYEATYQWRTDPDNYFRFTGYVYLPGGKTKSAGLEALFPVSPSIRN